MKMGETLKCGCSFQQASLSLNRLWKHGDLRLGVLGFDKAHNEIAEWHQLLFWNEIELKDEIHDMLEAEVKVPLNPKILQLGEM